MKKLRELIGEVTGYHYKNISFGEAFYTISKDGKLDHRLKTTLLGALCDWLEEFEKEFFKFKKKTEKEFIGLNKPSRLVKKKK